MLAVILLAAPVIVMNSYKGIRNTPVSLIQMCRAFLGTRRQEVLKIVLPPVDTSEARAFFEKMKNELPFDPRAELEN